MLFNSYEFVFAYLPLVLLVFFGLARWNHRAAALWLAVASVFFYGWWNPRFVALLLASVVANYGFGLLIARAPRARGRVLLFTAIAADLALLAVFKYANFFIRTVDDASGHLPLLDIVLPAGISFFTFTQIAFLVDTWKGIAREADFVHYLLFVSWFPHLIAGPVLHHKEMMPQFAHAKTYRPDAESMAVGLTLFAFGLFKKVILADSLARYANPVFDAAAHGAQPALAAAWIGALAYTLQLYFDFSGYSDMAIGISRVFNVRLPLNFDSPYKAASVIEFWRRWHMTLSRFLRDYLYVPLGGNRHGPARRHLNLMATMLLGGLWHGAGWNFVLWGGLHGAYLVVNHGWRHLTGGDGTPRGRGTHALAVLLTFLVVVIAWVPFRATSTAAAMSMLAGMAGLHGVSLPEGATALASHLPAALAASLRFDGLVPGLPVPAGEALAWLLAGFAIVWTLPNTQEWLAAHGPACQPVSPRRFFLTWQANVATGVLMSLVFTISVLSFTRNSPFLYFQF